MDKIVSLTLNPTIDKSTSVDTVSSEIKLRCENPSMEAGGGGINVSRAIHKLGGESTAVYTKGSYTGRLLNDLLDTEGIDHIGVPIEEATRESWTVFEKTTTLQYRFGMEGPTLNEREWQACIERVIELEPAYVVASGSLPPGVPVDFYKRMIDALKAYPEIKVVVDTSGDALYDALEAGVYLMKPNLRELEIFSKKKIDGEIHLKNIGQELINTGKVEVLVVSLGAAGAAMITADEFKLLRAPLVRVKSKVGAGDSMVGGIVMGLADGYGLENSVRMGIAAGTAAVMTEGTQLCRQEDALRLYDEIKVLD